MTNTESKTNRRSDIQWQPIIELAIVLITILGSTIPLYLHTDSKIDAMHITINAIQKEIQDFHGRLCGIEERTKK